MPLFNGTDLDYINKLNSLANGLLAFSSKAADFTAVAGNWYLLTATGIQVTLPVAAAANDRIRFAGTVAAVLTVVLLRNGLKIDSAAANLTVGGNERRVNFELMYIDATVGWRVIQYADVDVIDSAGSGQNFGIVATRGSNAETIALKTKAGADPSSTDPIKIAFRDAALTTGGYSVLTINAAVSITIPSTALMGATNGVAFRLWLVAFNDGGTFRLGVVKAATASGIMPLKDDLILSATAIDTASDSAGVIYAGAAVTAKAMRVLGYLDYNLAAAGTWGTAPVQITVFDKGMKLPGDTVQTVWNQTGTMATGTTVLPQDNTIPQITEGDQFMTQAIVPTAAANKLVVEHVGQYSESSNAAYVAALFQDATAGALAAMAAGGSAGNPVSTIVLKHEFVAGQITSTTLRIRAGGSAGTLTFNGNAGAQWMGGVMASRLAVTEIMA